MHESAYGPSRPISYKKFTSAFGAKRKWAGAANAAVSVENDPNRKSDWFSKRWVVAKTHGHPLDHRTELDYTFGLAAWPVN